MTSVSGAFSQASGQDFNDLSLPFFQGQKAKLKHGACTGQLGYSRPAYISD